MNYSGFITIDAIRTISSAVSVNNTLQILKIITDESISKEVRKNPHQFDHRITM